MKREWRYGFTAGFLTGILCYTALSIYGFHKSNDSAREAVRRAWDSARFDSVPD